MGKNIIIGDGGIRIEDDENKEVVIKTKKSSFAKKLSALTPVLSLLIFLILGFCFQLWHPGWVVFLLIPFIEIAISHPKNRKAKWTGIAFMVSIIAYLLVGLIFNIWHPTWLIFFLVPITSILAK